MFRVSHFFGKVDCRYTDLQIETLISGKLSFPFNLCVNIDQMASVTKCPEKHAFTDLLSDGREISSQDHQHFSNLWSTLNFDNLLTCLFVYRWDHSWIPTIYSQVFFLGRSSAKITQNSTRPDTRPIPVADGWAGAEMRVFPLFDSRVTDRPTDRRTDKASYRVACPRLKMTSKQTNELKNQSTQQNIESRTLD